MSRHSLLLMEGLVVATENNYQGGTRVLTEFFYVATEGVGCRSFLCCDIGSMSRQGMAIARVLLSRQSLATTAEPCRDKALGTQ